MKAIIVGLFFCLFMFSSVVIAEEKEKPVEYEVTLHIVYNSISADKVSKLVQDIMKEHESACSVDIDINKNGENNNVIIDGDIYTTN